MAGALEADTARGVTGHEQASAAGTDEAGIHAGVLSALQCREHMRPVIVPGEPWPVFSSESCSGCSGLDSAREHLRPIAPGMLSSGRGTDETSTMAGALEAAQA